MVQALTPLQLVLGIDRGAALAERENERKNEEERLVEEQMRPPAVGEVGGIIVAHYSEQHEEDDRLRQQHAGEGERGASAESGSGPTMGPPSQANVDSVLDTAADGIVGKHGRTAVERKSGKESDREHGRDRTSTTRGGQRSSVDRPKTAPSVGRAPHSTAGKAAAHDTVHVSRPSDSAHRKSREELQQQIQHDIHREIQVRATLAATYKHRQGSVHWK